MQHCRLHRACLILMQQRHSSHQHQQRQRQASAHP
jgi:hypothetical protein